MAQKRNKSTQKAAGSNGISPLIILLVVVGLLVALYLFRNELPQLPSRVTGDMSAYSSIDAMLPKGPRGDQIVKHFAFTLAYDEETEQAEWVIHRLTAKYVTQGKERRTDDFREDDKVSTGSATLEDYSRTGYDRGHLAPAADFKWDKQAMSESFYFSNMSPQLPAFNRGIWNRLEQQVRDWAVSETDLIVVTGPVFKNTTTTVGINEVAVPDYYFKAILDVHPPHYKAIGFILKHEKSNLPLQLLAVSIDSVESFTGIDLFPGLPDEMEVPLEAETNVLNWPFNE